ncbi:MAG: YybH family protein [Gemmatimonadales bacterium]
MTAATLPDIRAAVAAGNQRFLTALSRGDAAAMAAVYSSDAKVLPPGGEPVAGAAAVEVFWRGALELGIKAARLETDEIELQGARAIEIGRYTLEGEAGRVLDRGKYLVVWRQEGGEWRLHRDIWNSSGSTATS